MRMSRKELEKRVEELEKIVFTLATMHDTIPSELVTLHTLDKRILHPKTSATQNFAKTSYGLVSFGDLARFVVDGEPLKFKMEDKELVKEVHPDGSVLDVVKNKEKKASYVPPKTVPYYRLYENSKGEKYFRQIEWGE